MLGVPPTFLHNWPIVRNCSDASPLSRILKTILHIYHIPSHVFQISQTFSKSALEKSSAWKPLNLWLLLLILFPIPYFFSAPYFDSEPPSKPGGGRPGSEIPLRSVTYSVRSHSFYISAPYFVPRSLFLSAPYSYFEPPPLPGGGRIPSPYFVSRSLFSSAPYFRERPVGVHQPLESAHEGPGRVSRGGFGPSPTFYSRSHGFSFFPRGRQAFSAAPRGAGIASARPLIARQSGAGPAPPKRVAPAVPAFCLFPRGAA